MARKSRSATPTLRPLAEADLARMTAIDQAQSGHSRRRFLAKRLAAAAAHPQDYVHIGLEAGGTLVGFVLARILRGEFGHAEPVAAFDFVGIAPDDQEQGHGHRLMAALRAALQERAIRRVHSQAEWTSHAMLRFFDSTGFRLASRIVLERSVAAPLAEELGEL
jgi:ribosomal protein S18 acetylase RimI-like enzyme